MSDRPNAHTAMIWIFKILHQKIKLQNSKFLTKSIRRKCPKEIIGNQAKTVWVENASSQKKSLKRSWESYTTQSF
jgi:hypothetical protein